MDINEYAWISIDIHRYPQIIDGYLKISQGKGAQGSHGMGSLRAQGRGPLGAQGISWKVPLVGRGRRRKITP